MGSLSYKGDLDDDAISSKLVCFGANDVLAFQQINKKCQCLD